jgi:DNA-binding transcriptional ArsR family regulator
MTFNPTLNRHGLRVPREQFDDDQTVAPWQCEGAKVSFRMVAAANMVEVGALVGDTARATMLAALMSGRSLTTTELAFLARVSRPTASSHLRKLEAARLVTVMRKRRFSYYRIASPLVASMLEAVIAVAAIEVPQRHRPRSAADQALRFARTCYDHLAGTVGVALTDALAARGHIILSDEGGEVTPEGFAFLTTFGVDLAAQPKGRRLFCQPCLDWSERRYHLKGRVGAGLLCRCLDLGWFQRERDTRALRITAAGRAGLAEVFGIAHDGSQIDFTRGDALLTA